MATLKIAGKELKLEIKDPCVGDMIAIEEEYGKPFLQWEADLESGRLRAMAVGLLIIAQRVDPSITMQDVLALDLPSLLAMFLAEKDEVKKAKKGKRPANPTKAE
jgi:hypothetical protein